MSEFKYEAFLMRFSFLAAVGAFVGVLIYAFLLDVSRNDKEENLAFQEAVVADLGDLAAESLPLDQPHRTNKEIQEWINQAISESLSFDAQNYEQVMKDSAKYFTSAGLAQFKDYIEKSNTISALQSNNYRMNIFLEEKPLYLNGVAVAGIYRWLYRVPVTISFMPRYLEDLSEIGSDVVNREINVQIQIRRVPAAENPQEMQIESWSVTARR